MNVSKAARPHVTIITSSLPKNNKKSLKETPNAEYDEKRVELFFRILKSYSLKNKIRFTVIVIDENSIKEFKGKNDDYFKRLKTFLKEEYHDRWIVGNNNLLTSGWGFTVNLPESDKENKIRKTELTLSTLFITDTIRIVNAHLLFRSKLEDFTKEKSLTSFIIVKEFKGK